MPYKPFRLSCSVSESSFSLRALVRNIPVLYPKTRLIDALPTLSCHRLAVAQRSRGRGRKVLPSPSLRREQRRLVHKRIRYNLWEYPRGEGTSARHLVGHAPFTVGLSEAALFRKLCMGGSYAVGYIIRPVLSAVIGESRAVIPVDPSIVHRADEPRTWTVRGALFRRKPAATGHWALWVHRTSGRRSCTLFQLFGS